MTLVYALVYIYVFIVGIIIGSFLNVCIFRIPKKETIVLGRSHCMTCMHELSWKDLFPLFSYIFLRGKCRYCKAPISPRYPIIEALTGVLFLLSVIKFGFLDLSGILHTVLFCAFFAVLVVVAMIDFDTMEIPDRFHIIILALGIAAFFICPEIGWKERLLGMFIVSVPMFILAMLGGMGQGDVKLMLASGLLVGARAVVLAFFIGCIFAAIFGIVIKIKKKEKQIPFGPFLSIGLVCGSLFGPELVSTYLSLLSL